MTRAIFQLKQVYEPAINVKRDFIFINFWREVAMVQPCNMKRLSG
jgi:hypothetical protein